MGVMERFFGKRGEDDAESALVANTARENKLSLQILFEGPLSLDPVSVTLTLRDFQGSLTQAVFELDPEVAEKGSLLGLAGWEDHVVQVVGIDAPLPAQVVEMCVQPAHYGPDLKQKAREHKSHILLYYAGHEEDPLEQYVALAVVCATLAAHGAVIVLNESGHTSFPVAALAAAKNTSDALDVLRSLPIPILYCGFVKYNLEGGKGVWMRTYGAYLLGLPDLASLTEGHHQGEHVFDIFTNVFNYLRSTSATLGAGHTMQVGPDTFMRLRLPTAEEPFLESEGDIFVAELISENEINRSS